MKLALQAMAASPLRLWEPRSALGGALPLPQLLMSLAFFTPATELLTSALIFQYSSPLIHSLALDGAPFSTMLLGSPVLAASARSHFPAGMRMVTQLVGQLSKPAFPNRVKEFNFFLGQDQKLLSKVT